MEYHVLRKNHKVIYSGPDRAKAEKLVPQNQRGRSKDVYDMTTFELNKGQLTISRMDNARRCEGDNMLVGVISGDGTSFPFNDIERFTQAMRSP